MKTQLFKQAWIYFKKYSITFSQALTKAWNDFKRAILVKEYNKIPSTKQYAKKKEEAKKAIRAFKDVDFDCVFRSIVSNAGAAHYYGKGFYNAD